MASSGMGKRAAKAMLDAGDVTWDDLRGLLGRVDPKSLDETSRVNGQISKHASHKVYIGALAGRTGPVRVWKLDPYCRKAAVMKRTAESLIAQNILRDFGERAQRPGKE